MERAAWPTKAAEGVFQVPVGVKIFVKVWEFSGCVGRESTVRKKVSRRWIMGVGRGCERRVLGWKAWREVVSMVILDIFSSGSMAGRRVD